MKKFSILIAAMAILVAVTSAFKTPGTIKYEAAGITPGAVTNNQMSSNPTTARANFIVDAFYKLTTSSTSFAAEKSAWNSSHSTQVSCVSDTDQLCGAAVTYDDSNISGTIQLVDYEGGDYQLL